MPGARVSSHSHPRSSLHHVAIATKYHLIRCGQSVHSAPCVNIITIGCELSGHGSGADQALGELGEGRQAQQQHPDRSGRHWPQGRPRRR